MNKEITPEEYKTAAKVARSFVDSLSDLLVREGEAKGADFRQEIYTRRNYLEHFECECLYRADQQRSPIHWMGENGPIPLVK